MLICCCWVWVCCYSCWYSIRSVMVCDSSGRFRRSWDIEEDVVFYLLDRALLGTETARIESVGKLGGVVDVDWCHRDVLVETFASRRISSRVWILDFDDTPETSCTGAWCASSERTKTDVVEVLASGRSSCRHIISALFPCSWFDQIDSVLLDANLVFKASFFKPLFELETHSTLLLASTVQETVFSAVCRWESARNAWLRSGGLRSLAHFVVQHIGFSASILNNIVITWRNHTGCWVAGQANAHISALKSSTPSC